jgi:hypothetical protein
MDSDSYRTSDTGFAAYLLATAKSRLKRVECDTSGQGWYVFDPAPPGEAMEEFVNGGTAPATRLIEAVRLLKTRLHSEIRQSSCRPLGAGHDREAR